MITIPHIIQYKIVLKIFKISGNLSKKSDNGLWPGGNKNTGPDGQNQCFLRPSSSRLKWSRGKVILCVRTKATE